MPAGFAEDGMPIGVQLLASDFSEARLLRIGHAYERASDGEEWRKRRPAIIKDA
jgi:Asp-tRNA(Asn)/Glu-tRNA(Gln) amidotransferase A subunit family amidase